MELQNSSFFKLVIRDLDRQSGELLCVFPSEDLVTPSITPKSPKSPKSSQKFTSSPVPEKIFQLPDHSKNIRQISAPSKKLQRSATVPRNLNPLRRMNSLQVPTFHPPTPPKLLMSIKIESENQSESPTNEKTEKNFDIDDAEMEAVVDQLVQQALDEAADHIGTDLTGEQAQLVNEVATFYEDCVLPEVHRLVLNGKEFIVFCFLFLVLIITT